MEIIRKKINLELLRSHSFGLAPYIPVNEYNGSKIIPFIPASGVNGNWGGIICDCSEFDSYGQNTETVLRKYYTVRAILNKGLCLKRFKKNNVTYYTSDLDEDIRKKDFIPCDENLFIDLGKGVFQEKNGENTINFKYIRLVSKEDRDTYFNLGGDSLIKKVEVGLFGLITIPSNISGPRVPGQFYVSQIPVWLKWFEDNRARVKNEPKDCCIEKEWDERGGDAMYHFLVQNSNLYERELQKWERLQIQQALRVPSIEIPILLTQTYEDNGVMSVYEEDDPQFNYTEEIRGLRPSAQTYEVGFTTESRLQELRSRDKVYSDNGDLMPFIWTNSQKTATTVPYVVGEVFNPAPNPQKGADYFTGDYIESIERNNGMIEFTYAFGADIRLQNGRFIFGDPGTNGGIEYREKYDYTEKEIEFGNATLTYEEIDFNNKIFTIYNKDFELARDTNLSHIVGLTTGDVWRGGVASNAPVFKKEYLNHISEEPKINVNIEIERGGASAFENHFRLSECNTYEDLRSYHNNIFNL